VVGARKASRRSADVSIPRLLEQLAGKKPPLLVPGLTLINCSQLSLYVNMAGNTNGRKEIFWAAKNFEER